VLQLFGGVEECWSSSRGVPVAESITDDATKHKREEVLQHRKGGCHGWKVS
jgi:hypothetical protein